MKIINISLIVLGSAGAIHFIICSRNPFKFDRSDRDNTNTTPAPENKTIEKDRPQKLKRAKILIG